MTPFVDIRPRLHLPAANALRVGSAVAFQVSVLAMLAWLPVLWRG